MTDLARGSPFHPGELALQRRVGVADKVARFGERAIRSVMPDEHREFFTELPYVFVASLDEAGRPWASMLWGAPGFVSSPEPALLRVAGALPAGDPLIRHLHVGVPLGVLGIQLETRRRNRVNGTVLACDGTAFTLGVTQSFGNCQKYIQRRFAVFSRDPQAPHDAARVAEGARLSREALAIVTSADTCFIASRSAAPASTLGGEGVDVSHRGGRPGFVSATEDGARSVLTLPDYVGNFLFNTLGNVQADPRVGLLFPDFARGGLLSLTGEAEIVWDGPAVAAVAGAQRLLRIAVSHGTRVERVLPFTWTDPEFAAQL